MNRNVIEGAGIDSPVPKNHLLRKIDQAVDFNCIYRNVVYCWFLGYTLQEETPHFPQ